MLREREYVCACVFVCVHLCVCVCTCVCVCVCVCIAPLTRRCQTLDSRRSVVQSEWMRGSMSHRCTTVESRIF